MSVTNERGVPPGKPADPPSGTLDERQDRRKQFLWSGVLQTACGPFQCTVVDISRGGARLSTAATVKIGQSVTLVVTGVGMFRGTVVWGDGSSVGIEFAGGPGSSSA